jgi:hypothetical protein
MCRLWDPAVKGEITIGLLEISGALRGERKAFLGLREEGAI